MKKHARKASSCRVQFLRHNKSLRHHSMPLQVCKPPFSAKYGCFLMLSGGNVMPGAREQHVVSFCNSGSNLIHCSKTAMFDDWACP